MFAKKTLAAGLVALSALAAVPANAGSLSVEFGYGAPGYHSGYRWGHYENRRQLSSDQVRFILRNKGYYDIRFIDSRGAAYQVSATKNHRRYGLTVSARSGDVLNLYPIRWRG